MPVFAAESYKTRLRLSTLLMGPIDDATCEFAKSLGLEGFEIGMISLEDGEKLKRTLDKWELVAHNVKRGFSRLDADDAAIVEEDLRSYQHAIRLAKCVGANSIEIVPCTLADMPMPKANEFHIDFDEKTGMIQAVVRDDNMPFEKYIKAHNHAFACTQKVLERILPFAEEHGVVIGIENVGFMNNFCVHPAIYANLIRSFQSKYVRAYFDMGNNVLYSPPEEWILTFKKEEIVKLHCKDYLIDANDSSQGRFVPLGEGSVNWIKVRDAIEKIGYSGWMTNESDSLPLVDFLTQKDQFAKLTQRLGKIAKGEKL